MKKLFSLSIIVIAGLLVAGLFTNLTSYAIVPGVNAAIDVNTSGGSPNATSGYGTTSADMSQDGRFIVFTSTATNLVSPNTTGSNANIFVRDRLSGVTELISKSTSGTQANNVSQYPRISDDGRYVVYSSRATNLVSGDTNNRYDIFVRDRSLNTTVRVSITSAGTEANNDNWSPDISADGKYVVWSSAAPNLWSVGGLTGTFIFQKDLSTGVITMPSSYGNGNSDNARISCEGRFIIFESNSNNLTAGDTTNSTKSKTRTYIFDTLSPSTPPQYIRGASNGSTSNSSISCNGNYITFESSSTNLVSGDTNARYDIFMYDRVNDTIKRVSVSSSGAQANDDSFYSNASNDGKYVTFSSVATNLVSSDTNGRPDIFVRNMNSNTTEAVSRDSAGVFANGNTKQPFISSDGKYIVYYTESSAPVTNLISGFTGNVYAAKSGADYDY